MRALFLPIILVAASCASDLPVSIHTEISDPSWVGGEAARRGVTAQMEAWNRGDLEAALQAYWDSPKMTWVSKSGVDYGYAPFADAMRKDFTDPKSMGIYSVEILDARNLGRHTEHIVFRWKIMKGEKRLMGGISTQIWRRIDGNWHAVFEHAS